MRIGALLFSVLAASALRAQVRSDTVRRPAPVPAVAQDTLFRSPVSPKRALISSLLVPGLGQSKLQRPVATALFAAVEFLSLAMVRKSSSDLSHAKRLRGDSVIVGYQLDPSTGHAVFDDDTGQPIVIRRAAAQYDSNLLGARRTHLEDWIAVLAFNHLISGVDAFVGAHLWDVPARVSLRALPRAATLSVNAAW